VQLAALNPPIIHTNVKHVNMINWWKKSVFTKFRIDSIIGKVVEIAMHENSLLAIEL